MPNEPTRTRPSHLPQSPSQASHEQQCSNGHRFIAKSGAGCPQCGSASVKQGDEITKKVIDDNDLIK